MPKWKYMKESKHILIMGNSRPIANFNMKIKNMQIYFYEQ